MSSILRRPSLGPRVRGLRVKSLPRDKAVALAYASSPDEYLNVLRTTQYQVSIDKLTKDTLNDLREQIIKTYMNNVKELYLGAPEDGREVIRLHLRRFEYENIEYIITAIRSGKNPEDFVITEPLDFTGRRYVVTSLLGARSVEEVGERLKALGHPAAEAFELMQKFGYDKFTIFIDRQWILDYTKSLSELKDKSIDRLVNTLTTYFDVVLAVRAKIWGLSPEEIASLTTGMPSGIVKEIFDATARGEVARTLDLISGIKPWGQVIASMASEEPTFENLSVVLDNAYPAIMRKLADACIVECSEFSLGSLLASLEYMRAEAMLIVKAAAMLVEGVSVEKRRSYFAPLTLI
ncbi:MAG: V-type ATPase subunit [Thermoproteus sp.]